MSHNGLNLFQRLTRRWESVHPYNAAQMLCLRGRLDVDTATGTWGESLRALGLGRVRVCSRDRIHLDVLNGELARYPVRALPVGSSLAEHLTTELNRRFDDPDEPPYRPFLLQRENDFYFGVVYQHWVADSVSIRAVLGEWFTRLFDPSTARTRPLLHPREGYWGLFGARNGWKLDETLMASVRSHLRHRRVRKVRTAGAEDYPVRVTIHEAPSGLIDQLRGLAREQQVKVHDLLLAAVAQVSDQFVPAQLRRNRPDLSVGAIVDLRRHATTDLRQTFGLFLGFTNVVCGRNDLRDWPRLLRSVAAQNRIHKKTGLAQASLVWMMAALAADRFVPNDELYHFYRKELPMLGGLSNVNLNDTWAARYHPEPLLEYLRVSPTGPLVPLVFSTTTLGSKLSFALTCRDALLPPHSTNAMAAAFVNRLTQASNEVGLPHTA
jgi:hypothetical protein